MKNSNRILTYPFFIMGLLLMLICSCKKGDNGQTSDSNLYIGKYECNAGGFLEISKVDNKTINLHFTIVKGQNSSWDHTFTATVTGTTLSIKDQYWSSPKKFVTAGGVLTGDILTIDYFYSDGSSETGLIYNRVK